MKTKLAAFCETIMEAGWLIALIVEPIFFNVYSDRVFEPDKISILRSIAMVLIAAWVIRFIENTRPESTNDSENEPTPSLWTRIKQTPLALPTLLLIAVYLLSTLLSIAPRLSIWGSYQRLQGTYSTLSYITIFGIILGTLRRREQLERLVLIAIVASLPVSMYGLMQHFELDPLPWGGNVIKRVASNMGNSIFVAAYLIMIVPLTLRNLLERLLEVLQDQPREVSIAFVVGYLVALGIQIYAWGAVGFGAGLLVGLVFIFFAGLFSLSIRKPVLDFFWIGTYSVILAAQLVCIFFTQSRGPWIGLLAGLFFFVLAVAFAQRIRILQWGSIIIALLGITFLALLNMPGTFLEPIKETPYIGRLGTIFEMEDGTGKVRTLIWEGVVELMLPHEPIGLPDDKDSLNAIRPLVGYGPESMIVAYNPFYPPDLAHHERRNATPDRSHNETFDALVITGFIGFVVYFSLFISLFYHSFKWLGLIANTRDRNIFLGMGLGGALLGALIPAILEGSLRLVGVGLPFGFIVGVGGYLILSTFIVLHQAEQLSGRNLLLIALLSAVVAHFVEIHFGIAIASTRTYFWTYAGVLVVLGMRWLPMGHQAPTAEASTTSSASNHASRRRSQRSQRRKAYTPSTASSWRWASVLAFAILVGMVFATLGFDFITNQQGLTGTTKIVGNSLTALIRDRQVTTSYAMLWLFLFTWLAGGLLILTQTPHSEEEGETSSLNDYALTLIIYASITLIMFLIFGLSHASRIQPGADVANVITPYYWLVFIAMLACAIALAKETPLPSRWLNPDRKWVQAITIPLLTVICAVFINALNISIIKADIYYKQGKHFDSGKNYDAAIQLYQRALSYATDQDFYYLFLGRAYLTKATTISDPIQRAPWLERASETLEQARRLNPLNTDHSANLARLHRTRAEIAQDPATREQELGLALDYYEDAVTLSPNTAKLYNEWGLIYAMLGENEKALEKWEKSLALDDRYEETYTYLGNYYLNQQDYDQAAEAYRNALELAPKSVQAHSALGFVYSKQGNIQGAIEQNLAVLEFRPTDYASKKNLAILYQQENQYDKALQYARLALDQAPTDEAEALRSFIEQLQAIVDQ